MSPLGSLSARGVHYSPSPLGRSSSFVSVASDKSSTLDGPNDGPLGSGALIPAAYPPRGPGQTPRLSGLPPRQTSGISKQQISDASPSQKLV